MLCSMARCDAHDVAAWMLKMLLCARLHHYVGATRVEAHPTHACSMHEHATTAATTTAAAAAANTSNTNATTNDDDDYHIYSLPSTIC